MLRWEYQVLIIILLYIIDFTTGIIWYQAITPIPLSPIHFFLTITISIIGVGLLFFPIAKGKSPPFESNAIFASVNSREKFIFEWTNQLIKERAKQTIKMVAMPLGGIDSFKIHPSSTVNDPLVVFPAKYLKKKGRGYSCDANLNRKDECDFPPDMRLKLMKRYRYRFKNCKNLYLAYTGNHDSSISSKNEQIEFEYTRDNRSDNYYLEKLDEVMTLKERINDKLNNPLKKIGVISDENDFS